MTLGLMPLMVVGGWQRRLSCARLTAGGAPRGWTGFAKLVPELLPSSVLGPLRRSSGALLWLDYLMGG